MQTKFSLFFFLLLIETIPPQCNAQTKWSSSQLKRIKINCRRWWNSFKKILENKRKSIQSWQKHFDVYLWGLIVCSFPKLHFDWQLRSHILHHFQSMFIFCILTAKTVHLYTTYMLRHGERVRYRSGTLLVLGGHSVPQKVTRLFNSEKLKVSSDQSFSC